MQAKKVSTLTAEELQGLLEPIPEAQQTAFSPEELQRLFDRPDPGITQAMLEEHQRLVEELAAVQDEIAEALLLDAPMETGPLTARLADRRVTVIAKEWICARSR
jgi:hypothetical protein